MSNHADLEWVFINASHVRVHQHVTGINHQAISKSIGGNSSKIHLVVDANGNPIEFIIGDGTTHDVKVAPELIDALDLKETKALCADIFSERKSKTLRLKQIYPRNVTLKPSIKIWISIYVK